MRLTSIVGVCHQRAHHSLEQVLGQELTWRAQRLCMSADTTQTIVQPNALTSGTFPCKDRIKFIFQCKLLLEKSKKKCSLLASLPLSTLWRRLKCVSMSSGSGSRVGTTKKFSSLPSTSCLTSHTSPYLKERRVPYMHHSVRGARWLCSKNGVRKR